MKVRHGWSGEVANGRWAKFDIHLEEDDLRRMLGPGYDKYRNLTTTAAYQLLELEAERLVLAKLVRRYGFDPEQGKRQMAELETQRQVIIAHIKSAGM